MGAISLAYQNNLAMNFIFFYIRLPCITQPLALHDHQLEKNPLRHFG